MVRAASLFFLLVCSIGFVSSQDLRFNDLLSRAESLTTKGSREERVAAAAALAKALDALPPGSDVETERKALTALGRLSDQTGDTPKALDCFTRALPLLRDANDEPRLLTATYGLAQVYSRMGEPYKAIDKYNEALVLTRKLHNRFQEGITLNNLGIRYWAISDFDKALENLQAAMEIRRSTDDTVGVAYSLEGLTSVYYEIGEFQKALDSATEALGIWRAQKDKVREANSLSNIGLINYALNQPERALRYDEEALRLMSDDAVRTRIVNNMGLAHFALGQYDTAIREFNSALEHKSAPAEPRTESYVLHNLGDVYLKQGKPQQSIDYYQRSIALKTAAHDLYGEAFSLNDLGECLTALHRAQEATGTLRKALQIRREIHDRAGEAVSLAALARALREGGDLGDARTNIEQALTIVENSRFELANADLRASYFSSTRKWYDFYIDLLMQLDHMAPDPAIRFLALQASERSRSRRLLDSLSEVAVHLRSGVPSALIAEEQAASRRLRSEMSRVQSGQAANAARLAQVLDDYSAVEARIRRSSPKFAQLLQTEPATESQIFTLVDRDSILLEYSLGDEHSYLFAVTNHQVAVFPLPSRVSIEKLVAEIRASAAAYSSSVPSETLEQRKARFDAADRKWQQASSALSGVILKPAARLMGQKRILIAADGALQVLPFSALPDPSGGQPLLVRHEIVSIPSASAIVAGREQFRHRPAAPKEIAVIADPVFSASDDRLKIGSLSASRGPAYLRLRYSRAEAERILALKPPVSEFHAFDFSASRKLLEGSQLADYRVVHFATHAVVPSGHSELAGLVLSMVDQQGHPQDGLVTLNDIYNLRWNADLVVLGACEAAIGENLPGEGLQSLTRAFQYAGVPRVMATLWQVDDRATSDLMYEFYLAMWKKGRRPAAAVREAQLAVRANPRYAAPWFWAAFTMNGEWQ